MNRILDYEMENCLSVNIFNLLDITSALGYREESTTLKDQLKKLGVKDTVDICNVKSGDGVVSLTYKPKDADNWSGFLRVDAKNYMIYDPCSERQLGGRLRTGGVYFVFRLFVAATFGIEELGEIGLSEADKIRYNAMRSAMHCFVDSKTKKCEAPSIARAKTTLEAKNIR